jgi:SET domain-containing protein
VFARVAFAPGERIGEYRGRHIHPSEMEERWRRWEPEAGHTFFFIVDEDRVIDAWDGGNGIRYINHSCAPNCATVIEGRRVFVDALRRIGPGEELTYDYLLEPGDVRDAIEHFACACGARACRGTMVDPSLLTPELLREARRRAVRRRA